VSDPHRAAIDRNRQVASQEEYTMSIDQYEEEFAPDPRASQRVAAAKRARQPSDVAPAAPAAPTRDWRQLLLAAIGALSIAGVIALAIFQPGNGGPKPLAVTPQARTLTTDVPSLLSQHSASGDTPASTPVLVAMIDAYAAPGGVLLGQFDPAAEVATFVGRYDGGWVQIARPDGSHVWARQSDLVLDQDDLAAIAAVPDLTPRDTQPMTGRGNGPAPDVQPIVIEQQPAAAPVAEQPCSEATASYTAYRTIAAGGRAVGNVVAYSCVSYADAEAQADAQETAIRHVVSATAANNVGSAALDPPPPTPAMGPGGGGGGSW